MKTAWSKIKAATAYVIALPQPWNFIAVVSIGFVVGRYLFPAT